MKASDSLTSEALKHFADVLRSGKFLIGQDQSQNLRWGRGIVFMYSKYGKDCIETNALQKVQLSYLVATFSRRRRNMALHTMIVHVAAHVEITILCTFMSDETFVWIIFSNVFQFFPWYSQEVRHCLYENCLTKTHYQSLVLLFDIL